MNIFKKSIYFIVTLFFSYLSASSFARFYDKIFGQSGTYVDLSFFSGAPLSYVFFLTLIFTLFGGEKKYWWIGILLIPAAIFEVYFDAEHIYFPIILGLVGWLIGTLILKLKPKS